MKLQTHITLEKQTHDQIDYQSKILLLGSCFVENIGEKLEFFKFQTFQNPFGILFHPKAIETFISNIIYNKKYTEKDVFFHNEQWHCYDAHSKLSSSDKEELLKSLNENLNVTSEMLHDATHIIITLGTAWIYKNYKTNLPVANCHKVPQKEFIKELLSVDDITDSLKLMVNHLHQINPKVNIIFTVSPIRHLKDGFVENSQSKAHLISAVHQVLNQSSDIVNHNLFYFPSYEIMLDELRDYRFYTEDMLHPNQTAVNYIWEKFQQIWISDESQEVMKEVESIQNAMKHRPFNPNSEAHQKFLQQLTRKKETVHAQVPHILFPK
ncbi:MAG: GSCFA domain-containing protein [Aquaticitalea sp.]